MNSRNSYERCPSKFDSKRGIIILGTKVLVIFVVSSLLIATLFYHSDRIDASTNDLDINNINNETFVENPTGSIDDMGPLRIQRQKFLVMFCQIVLH